MTEENPQDDPGAATVAAGSKTPGPDQPAGKFRAELSWPLSVRENNLITLSAVCRGLNRPSVLSNFELKPTERSGSVAPNLVVGGSLPQRATAIRHSGGAEFGRLPPLGSHMESRTAHHRARRGATAWIRS